jgi:putative molybdopterin biosynthesis protein
LVGRAQGLFIAKGNPKGIQGIEDLKRSEINFVNRQHGSGTRLLLDYLLKQHTIQPGEVRGYDHEEFTHLSVAALVKSGRIDTALGIEAASYALDLEFLPLITERYDLIIPEEYYQSDLLQPLLDLLTDPEFKKAVSERPGYDVSEMGKLVSSHPE